MLERLNEEIKRRTLGWLAPEGPPKGLARDMSCLPERISGVTFID
jgi:hypothetical protein